MDIFKKILIGVVVGFILMCARKYLFINASAITTNGTNINTPNWSVVNSPSGQTIRVYAQDMYPGLSSWNYSYVLNKFVYVSFCTDMPSLGYGKDSIWNSTTGSYATAEGMQLTGNLSDKTCTFSNGYKGKVMYIKFKLVSPLLSVGNSDTTWPLDGYVSFWISSSANYSITAQSVVVTESDVDIYSSDFNIDAMVSAQYSTTNAVNNSTTIINGSINAIKDADISSTAKQPVDDTEMNNYSDKESTLFDSTSSEYNVDDTLDVGLDANGSEFLWNTITRFIQTHAKVFGCVISMLSLGLIKLALGR